MISKEKLLLDIQDLVLTLRSPNFLDSKVQKLWDKKRIDFDKGWKELSVPDFVWLNEEYVKWHKEVVVPFLTGDLAIYANEKKFPWL